MKKLLYISLLTIYLTSIIGVSISYHFCGDYLQSVNISFTAQPKEPNDCCGTHENNNGCCHTQIKQVKINDSQLSESTIKITNYKELVSFINITTVFYSISDGKNILTLCENSPPKYNSNKIYLTNSLFLI